MGLNQDLCMLIKSVAENKLDAAKQYAKIIIANDNTEKNKRFCSQMKTKLEQPTMNLLELPASVSGLLKMENTEVSFNEQRYFLSDREKEIAEKILSTKIAVDKLSEMGVHYINATMLYGESGTGKTTFGRYMAYKMGVPFAYVNFSECISSYLGSTGKNISKVFDFVKDRPCVLMLDELDAIGTSRDKQNEVGEMGRVVIGLMQAFDTLENGVVVMAATNKPEIIDEALKRRFPIRHEVKALEANEVYEFAVQFMDSVGVEYDGQDLSIWANMASRKQSEIVNDITQRLIKSICENKQIDFKGAQF